MEEKKRKKVQKLFYFIINRSAVLLFDFWSIRHKTWEISLLPIACKHFQRIPLNHNEFVRLRLKWPSLAFLHKEWTQKKRQIIIWFWFHFVVVIGHIIEWIETLYMRHATCNAWFVCMVCQMSKCISGSRLASIDS